METESPLSSRMEAQGSALGRLSMTMDTLEKRFEAFARGRAAVAGSEDDNGSATPRRLSSRGSPRARRRDSLSSTGSLRFEWDEPGRRRSTAAAADAAAGRASKELLAAMDEADRARDECERMRGEAEAARRAAKSSAEREKRARKEAEAERARREAAEEEVDRLRKLTAKGPPRPPSPREVAAALAEMAPGAAELHVERAEMVETRCLLEREKKVRAAAEHALAAARSDAADARAERDRLRGLLRAATGAGRAWRR